MSSLSVTNPGVRIRMYRQGFGDCFLLSFVDPAAIVPYQVLIDCGVLVGTPSAPDVMKKVVQNIAAETDGKIDLLIITHEHWDHLSGFVQAQDLFAGITAQNVFFAWTEDPEDPEALALRRKFAAQRHQLRLAMNAITDIDLQANVRQLLEMYGESTHDDAFGNLTSFGANTTSSALATVRAIAARSNAKVRYLRPGERLDTLPHKPNAPSQAAASRVFVLGPPRDRELLLRSDPSASENEIYALREFRAGVARKSNTAESDLPFDVQVSLPISKALTQKFFAEHYGAYLDKDEPNAPRAKRKKDLQLKPVVNSAVPDEEWRRIDKVWIDSSASDLALKLDSDTNNTSLVIAIELPRSKKVLLFAGDAQVGNWQSWDSVSWPSPGSPGDTENAQSLLQRTVLYKVGHHGSKNATLRSDKQGTALKGLELMSHPDLIAMIPVDAHFAAESKGWRDFPGSALLGRLLEKTKGRVVRSDQVLSGNPPSQISPATWKSFKRRYSAQSLFVDVFIDDAVESDPIN
jgi:hypothetical protein